MEKDLMNNVAGNKMQVMICSCLAKVIEEKAEREEKVKKEMMMSIDEGLETSKKEVKFDNLYDLMFS